MEIVEVDVEIVARTNRAVKVTDGCGEAVWLPLGCIYNVEPEDLLIGETLSIEISSDLAWEKGLV